MPCSTKATCCIPIARSSVKNRQRFNFGVLYPQSYSEAQSGADAWSMQTECLVEGARLSSVEVKVRFLKLVDRSVREATHFKARRHYQFESVPMLEVDGKRYVPWQEAVECEVTVPACNLETLTAAPLRWDFAFPAKDGTSHCTMRAIRLSEVIIRNGISSNRREQLRLARCMPRRFNCTKCK